MVATKTSYKSQSPRIGSMFLTMDILIKKYMKYKGLRRNPLESGQCFSLKNGRWVNVTQQERRNPLESGQCFSLILAGKERKRKIVK